MSPSVYAPNTHFSEIISKKIDYELVIYSRGGMSNLGICLQIESAISENADFIFVNLTSPDRIEIPISDSNSEITVHDIIYNELTSLSSHNNSFNKQTPKLISDTLFCLLEEEGHYAEKYNSVKNISEIKKSTRNYFEFLYNPTWKKKTDYWCLYACLHKIVESKIPFLFFCNKLEVKTHFNFIEEKNIFEINFSKYVVPDNKDFGYHTSPESQILISNEILNHIEIYKLLGK